MPILTRPRHPDRFDLFEVMHHGTHEKQMSNVFAWLLDADGSHNLLGKFVDIFLAEVNKDRPGRDPLKSERFTILQERNTADVGQPADIADIVMVGKQSCLVIENYKFSDGHHHQYENYLQFGLSHAAESTVVMLCELIDRDALKDGWEDAAVVTYSALVSQLIDVIDYDPEYRTKNPEQAVFIDQMYDHFSKGSNRVNDDATVDFVKELCLAGEVDALGSQRPEAAASDLGERLKQETIDLVAASRDLLYRCKWALIPFVENQLPAQLESLGVSDLYSSVYRRSKDWYTGSVSLKDDANNDVFHILFGHTAGVANRAEYFFDWVTQPVPDPDFSYIFLLDAEGKLTQSSVKIVDVLQGLADDDMRLAEEIVSITG